MVCTAVNLNTTAYICKLCKVKEKNKMEQIIEEYGIGGILFVIGTGVVTGLGKVLQLIAGV